MRSDRTAMEERRRSCPLCGAKMTPPAICCTAGNTEDNAKKHPFWGAFFAFYCALRLLLGGLEHQGGHIGERILRRAGVGRQAVRQAGSEVTSDDAAGATRVPSEDGGAPAELALRRQTAAGEAGDIRYCF